MPKISFFIDFELSAKSLPTFHDPDNRRFYYILLAVVRWLCKVVKPHPLAQSLYNGLLNASIQFTTANVIKWGY